MNSNIQNEKGSSKIILKKKFYKKVKLHALKY